MTGKPFFTAKFFSANGKKTGLENYCAPLKFLMQALQYLMTVVKTFVFFHIRMHVYTVFWKI